VGSGETLYVAKKSLIRPLFVAEMSLFRRCYSAVFSLLSAAVFRGKMTEFQRRGLGMIAKFLNMSGMAGLRGDGRTHPYGAEKGGIGRDRPACISPANSGGTGVAR
jgi:hypothetical protein